MDDDGGGEGDRGEPSATDATKVVPVPPSVPPYAGADDPFTLGVASGDPLADSVVLWTRLVPEGEAVVGDVLVRVELARDEAFTAAVFDRDVTAREDEGHSVHVVVEGLEADSWYWYRFSAGPFTSPLGRTRTTPAEDATVTQVVVGSASCQNYEDGWYVAHRDIAAAGLDLLVWLGDYVYEGAGQQVGVDGHVRTHGAGEASTHDDYRARYALYRRDPDLRAAHAACPWLVIWDDHEVENNYASDVSSDPSVPAEAFRARRAAAYRAWWEHMPVRLERPESADLQIYRSFRYGDLLQLSLLDGRQYRSDQTCGDVTASLEPACAETFEPTRTMLGSEQEAWLHEQLREAGGTWNAIAQPVIVANLTLNRAVLNYDQWDGYPAARDRLLQAMADEQVPNVVVLTGDVHFAEIANLRAPERGPIVGVEMVATSISSGGLVNPALTPLLTAIPDVVDADLAHRGWIKHTVTPERWQAEYRIVDDVKVADSPVGVHATYEVIAGAPGATKLG